MICRIIAAIALILFRCGRNKLREGAAKDASYIEENSYYLEVYNKDSDFTGSEVCAVDLKGFTEMEQVCKFSACRHLVHLSCIAAWNKTHSNSCPACWKDANERKDSEYPVIDHKTGNK